MSHHVTIRNTEHQFDVPDGETVLQAASAAGLILPYSCRDGACGSCKGKLVEGTVDYGQYAAKVLTDEEKAQGFALFCQAKPLSDIVIEVREVRRAGDIQVKKLPARVASLAKVSDDVMVLNLKLPASERFQFFAGQYVDILLKDGSRRELAIEHCVGSIEAPMSDAQLDDKFRAQCEPVLGKPRSEAALAVLWKIDALEDVAACAGVCAAA